MAQMGRPGLSEQQKRELWQRWKEGQSLTEIGDALGRHAASIHGVVSHTGGIAPPARRRSARSLTVAEREEISRGLAAGHSIRAIARSLGRAASTVSREIAEMHPAAFASAVNRRVLGSMNEFAWQAGAYLDRTDDALELARELSDTPMSAVGSRSSLGIPADVARELLAAHYAASSFRH